MVDLCNLKLSCLLPNHIPTCISILVHLSEKNCMNCITFTNKAPQVLRIHNNNNNNNPICKAPECQKTSVALINSFHLLWNSLIFRKATNNIKWYLTKYNCQHLLCELSRYMFKISTHAYSRRGSLSELSMAFFAKLDQVDWSASLNCFWLWLLLVIRLQHCLQTW